MKNIQKSKVKNKTFRKIIAAIFTISTLTVIPIAVTSCSRVENISEDYKLTTRVLKDKIYINLDREPSSLSIDNIWKNLDGFKTKIINSNVFSNDISITESDISIPYSDIRLKTTGSMNKPIITMNVFLRRYYFDGSLITYGDTIFRNNKYEYTEYEFDQNIFNSLLEIPYDKNAPKIVRIYKSLIIDQLKKNLNNYPGDEIEHDDIDIQDVSVSEGHIMKIRLNLKRLYNIKNQKEINMILNLDTSKNNNTEFQLRNNQKPKLNSNDVGYNQFKCTLSFY